MKIGILALGRPTFDVQYAKERLTASLNYLSSTNHNILGSCELLLDEEKLVGLIKGNVDEDPINEVDDTNIDILMEQTQVDIDGCDDDDFDFTV